MRRTIIWMIGIFLVLALVPPTYGQKYSDWSAPVNLGPPVNTAAAETDPFISKDSLSLYFACACPDSFGLSDIYVARRASLNDPWGPPQNLGPTVNSAFDDFGPVLSVDGHQLYFTSNRPGGFGGRDLYVSRRHNKRDDFGWRAPENLGNTINTPSDEAWAMPFEDDATGEISLYFSSNRPGGLGDDDIYVSTLQPDETFGSPVLVKELSSFSQDRHPNIRRDGLEFFLMSNRPGSIPNALGAPSFDLWVSTRASTSDPWSTPVNLGPVINTAKHDGHPSLSFDGTTLYFFSAARPGNVSPLFDIWMSTRTRLKIEEPD